MNMGQSSSKVDPFPKKLSRLMEKKYVIAWLVETHRLSSDPVWGLTPSKIEDTEH